MSWHFWSLHSERHRHFSGAYSRCFTPSPAGKHFHAAYIQYARWLVGGLTFQLAADIVESAFSPSWDEIGRLAAIAVIRTFVNYFLESDLAEDGEASGSYPHAYGSRRVHCSAFPSRSSA